MTRKRLSDILNGGGGNFADRWAATKAADDFGPLPPNEYTAHAICGELFTAKSGMPGYKITFAICDGEYAGRRLWADLWLSDAALPQTKRDLAKLGVTTPQQLEQPLPPGIRCKLKVTLRTSDDGTQFNAVKRFDVIGIDTPQADPYAPPDEESEADDPTVDPAAGDASQATGNAQGNADGVPS